MLHVTSLVKSFRSGSDLVRAVDNVSIEVERGEMLVLLGPSGCGKTTMLRCLAGLESADSGIIAFGDQVVYDSARGVDRPANKRNIGMVFQSYALWPHKTVRKNISYPLSVRGMKRQLREDGWVEAAAQLVDCGHLLDRYPGQLSGGQQQRVALARGLVARPDLLLFDEPLSNLDALLRTQVRNELHALHEQIGFTGVYVTHDQSEALALGDRLAIMRAGRVEQVGAPREVYEHPATEYAAHFVGFANRIVLRRDGDGWVTADGSPVEGAVPAPRSLGVVHMRFRPELAEVAPPGTGGVRQLSLQAQVVDVVYAGANEEITAQSGSERVVVRSNVTGAAPTSGVAADLHIDVDRARFFTEDGHAIAHDLVGTMQRTG